MSLTVYAGEKDKNRK